MAELTSFPFIKNDDFVDSFVYGVTVYRDEIMSGGTVHGGTRSSLPRISYDPNFSIGSKRISTEIGLIGAKSSASSKNIKYL